MSRIAFISILLVGCSSSTPDQGREREKDTLLAANWGYRPMDKPNPEQQTAAQSQTASARLDSALEGLERSAGTKPADIVFSNGYIYTVDRDQPLAEAVAVRDSKIVFVGSAARARRWVGPQTRLIDLHGRLMLPGLVDSHLHLDDGAASLSGYNLGGIQRSMTELRTILQGWLDASASQEPDTWLQVQGYRGALPRGYALSKADLDLLHTARPIIIANWDHHGLWVNSRALAICGITRTTPDVPGGVIGRDADGNPTGFFADAARDLILSHVPEGIPEDPLVGARTVVRALNAKGVTSAMQAIATDATLSLYSTLLNQGTLSLRLAHAISPAVFSDVFTTDETRAKAAIRQLRTLRTRYEVTDRFLVRTVKVILDGVPDFPAQNAWLLEPYLVQAPNGQWIPGNSAGEPFIEPSAFKKGVTRLNLAGWQIHTHALGDATTRLALDAYEHAQNAGAARELRNTIVHLEFVAPSDISRFAALNVVANVQPQWWEWDASTSDATKDYLGPARMARVYPGRSFERARVHLAIGSDWPVDPLMPWYALERAATRTAEEWYGYSEMGALVPNEAISLENAVRYYTLGSAYQLHLENKIGSISAGKYADLIVLDRNIFQVPITEVDQTQVLLTLFNGQVVYER